MNKFLLLLLLPLTMFASINIAVSYPYIGALTKSIGGEHVDTVVLAKGKWDPHFVVPRPSLISKVRAADALIMNGGQLEIGWLPPLINRASNPKTQVGAKTFLNLFSHVRHISHSHGTDRSMGDVHPDGNPHFHLDPRNILILSATIKDFLISIDSENKADYEKNYEEFSKMWKEKLLIWNERMKDKDGIQVLQFHDILAYFNKAYGLVNIATIEPLPGVPASSKHTMELIYLIDALKPRCILHDVYHSTKTADYISSKTGIEVIMMPHDIGALDGTDDLVSLFDYLTSAIK